MTREPIIQSLLDTDFYKFTMGQLVFRKYRDVPVRYGFKNRTRLVAIARHIKEEDLRRELDHVRDLKLTKTEIHYLRGTNEYQDRMFAEDYLQFLEKLELPSYTLERDGGTYKLEFAGPWSQAIYWETFALSIINELYYRSLLEKMSQLEREAVKATGIVRLAEKVKILKENPEVTFSDFGTRRRFSREWHEYVVKTLAKELSAKQFVGTSNVYLAMQYGLLPMGTSAHEMFMVMSGKMRGSEDQIRQSHNEVLRAWWAQYGWGLSIALTDTYGSDFFFRDMTAEQARVWKGLRQDSGDPIVFGEKAIAFYRKHGVDPTTKLIVFSDGLDMSAMLKIAKHFSGRIKVTFGWGTNLTNDLGLLALSLVIKVLEACGYDTVKLSDNLAKAIGKSESVELFKKIFSYNVTTEQECRY